MAYEKLPEETFLQNIREKRRKTLEYNEKYVDKIIKTLWESFVYNDVQLLTKATNYFVQQIINNASKPGIICHLDTTFDVPGFKIINSILTEANADPILKNNKKYTDLCSKYILHAFNILMASISKQTGIPIRLNAEYDDHMDGKNKLAEGIALYSNKTNYCFHIWW